MKINSFNYLECKSKILNAKKWSKYFEILHKIDYFFYLHLKLFFYQTFFKLKKNSIKFEPKCNQHSIRIQSKFH